MKIPGTVNKKITKNNKDKKENGEEIIPIFFFGKRVVSLVVIFLFSFLLLRSAGTQSDR